MSKKKKPARKSRPRTTYDVTYEHAQACLEKCRTQRTECITKLEVLSRQIPWYENLVQALTPVPEIEPPHQDPYAPQSYGAPPGPPPSEPAPAPEIDPEAFLAKFMPKSGRLTTNVRPAEQAPSNSTDPDEFLHDEPLV